VQKLTYLRDRRLCGVHLLRLLIRPHTSRLHRAAVACAVWRMLLHWLNVVVLLTLLRYVTGGGYLRSVP
jgi:hypothetical protein